MPLQLSSHVSHTEERVTITTTTRILPHGEDEYDETDERAGLLGQDGAQQPRRRSDAADAALSDVGSGSRRSFFEVVWDASAENMPTFDEGSIRGSVFNLASATLGAGALSVPYAFKAMGLGLGLAVIVICAVATTFSIRLLIIARTRTGLSSFEVITESLFGSTAAALVECSIAVFCFGSSVAYCKTIRDLLVPIIELYQINRMFPHYDVEKCVMGLIWLVLLLPLSLIRDINKLRYCSLLGVLTIIYLTAAISQHSLNNLLSGRIRPRWDHLDLWVSMDAANIIASLPIFLFAFTCQINVFAIFDGLVRSSDARMNKVTFRAGALKRTHSIAREHIL
jgi:amino acid permease